MLRPFLLAPLTALLLVGCSGDDNESEEASSPTVEATAPGEVSPTQVVAPPTEVSPTASATEAGGVSPSETFSPPGEGPYSAAAVWGAIDGFPTDLVAELHDCEAATTDCIAQVMQDNGASGEAIAFFQETGWFLTGFRVMGTVDLGTIVNPWRANANLQYFLMNGEPSLVSPEEEGGKLAFADDPLYQTLTDAVTAAGIGPTPADLLIWPSDNYYESSTDLGDGGQRFVFQYEVVNSAHAGGFFYFERVGLDFDGNGQYLGVSLIGLCRSSMAELDVAGVEACPPPSP